MTTGKQVTQDGSEIESAFIKALYARGLRYKKTIGQFNETKLYFKSIELAIFIDRTF